MLAAAAWKHLGLPAPRQVVLQQADLLEQGEENEQDS